MVDIDIETVCNKCGKNIETVFQGFQIIIDPCDSCMDDKSKKSYEEGYEEGLSAAEAGRIY